MAGITARCLLVLDRLYHFRAGAQTAPQEFSTESSIQPVHDLSRVSELGEIITNPGASGFFSLDQDNVHVGGDTVTAFIDPYGTLDGTWGEVGKRWIWLYKYAGSVSSAAVNGAASQAILALNVFGLGNALTRRDFLIDLWGVNDNIGIGTSLSATFPASLAHITARQPTFGMPLPIPLFPNSLLSWQSIATAAVAGTFRIEMICWIGPFGVYPPGLR